LEPPIPADEAKRLQLLQACNIIYTPAEEAFDDVAQLAADLCGTEIALITLVDSDYQWFKARVGVEQTGTSRDLSFCGHCINHRHPFIVEDTHLDPRFADNPLVTGDPFIRFYAGVPLLVDEGSAVGALSVADRSPRKLTPRHIESLGRLAKRISRELRLRRDLARAGEGKGEGEGSSSVAKIAPGAVLAGRWRVVRELGTGGAGAVFEARDERDRRVALKVLHPMWRTSDVVVERFAREARVLMRLKNPHIGQLLDVGNLDASQGGLPYLALEYLEGSDLDRIIRARGRVPYRDAFAWCADACEGLAEAHGLGIVHRDLKPSNVFLADQGGNVAPIVKVLDFGIAAWDPARGDPKITSMEGTIGSPAYMSPEQMLTPSDVDARSDVWSMGALLYELLTGHQPFRGQGDLQIFASVMTKAPTPVRVHLDDEELPAPAASIVMKCLQRKREERFDSMTALASELGAAALR
jgi:serine/threonine-protein kinase